MGCAIAFHKLYVGFDVGKHLLAPCLTLGRERCHGGNGREKRGLVKLVGLKPGVEAGADGGIGNDGVGTYDARDVESL